jgi:hypothetical protein
MNETTFRLPACPDPQVAERLRVLLSRYLVAFENIAATRRARPDTLHADACFAALRLHQRLRWPEGAALVNEVGACAHDVLQAWQMPGQPKALVAASVARHIRAVHRLNEALGVRELQAA